ncbi:hypothetical protein DYB32_001703 [Aphanomyces invadans]|uniref:THIF-type NAD/FAD binding fold domain-containing protein n=1 Tax=Aphanomyces invadans TaxID=157072 RepID=A0A418B5F4_9STRA|nr:hypothetical protein DYB32_001703 [Aphanomyces invadans]
MGVGHLGIVDGDYVDLSNLHRQVLHTPAKVGQLKVESARAAVLLRSPSIQVEVFPVRMDASNAVAIMESYDVVVDASDNVATRYLVNDMCCLLHKPLAVKVVSGLGRPLSGVQCSFDAWDMAFRHFKVWAPHLSLDHSSCLAPFSFHRNAMIAQFAALHQP